MQLKLPIFDSTGGLFGNQVSPNRLLNMYVASLPSKQNVCLAMIPGSKTVYSTTGTRSRLLWTNEISLFYVHDDTLLTFNTSLTPTTVGTFTTSNGYIGISANNSKQITFVDNVKGWVYDYTGSPTFTQITDVDFPSQPVDTTQLDGYTIVGQSSSNKWFISDIGDSTSWDALNFAELTSADDLIQAVRVLDRRIYIFGRFITEIFYNSESIQGDAGISTFPFIRDDNNIFQFGCASVGSIAQDDNKMVWLSSQKYGGPSIRMVAGGQAQKISNADIDYLLERLIEDGKDLSQSYGYLFKINGTLFYLINFIDADTCFVYNFDTHLWHEQEMIDSSTYFGMAHAYFNNIHYVADYAAAAFRVLSDTYIQNDDEDIHCQLITPVVENESMERIEIKRILIQCKQGHGPVTNLLPQNNHLITSFEFDPTLYLSISYDGGETYRNSLIKSTGKVGYYEWNTFWNSNGLNRRYVFKFEKFQPFKLIILNAVIVYELKGY